MGWRLPAGHPFQKHYATPSTDRSGAVKLAAPAMRRWVPELDSFYIEARERNPEVAILRACAAIASRQYSRSSPSWRPARAPIKSTTTCEFG